jgi:nucleoside-diphosphate-sugar epimerase
LVNSPVSHRRLFCFGLGYSAVRLAEALIAEGWTVAGTCRSIDAAVKLRTRGIDAHLFGGETGMDHAASALAGATHLLGSVPPGEGGDPVLRLQGSDIARCAHLEWAGYLSTTGVYGDSGGAWVDEGAPVRPTGARGERRAEAERAWLDLHRRHGTPVHVFRLAGIYGPGRSALDTARQGARARIVKPGHVFSRIHVDDIVATLMASIARPHPGTVYNVCDDLPAPNADVIAFACELLGIAPPPEIPIERAHISPLARSFYADNRRVRNDRIRDELGVMLRYPDYRTGLRAILAADG